MLKNRENILLSVAIFILMVAVGWYVAEKVFVNTDMSNITVVITIIPYPLKLLAIILLIVFFFRSLIIIDFEKKEGE